MLREIAFFSKIVTFWDDVKKCCTAEQATVLLFFQLFTAAFKAYCAIWVRRSNFRHQASPRVPLRESTQRRKVEL
jgi:hypothetical protein